ncbi:hypothetical protein IJG27_04040 [Candidatus Saccharibacteria bacterium]|nr:hypothetical protein [Candidatus Saccharibacteria bacterium]MBQ6409648.1 hypothetical protein [Candidatus Saccharibacteria bacterium]
MGYSSVEVLRAFSEEQKEHLISSPIQKNSLTVRKNVTKKKEVIVRVDKSAYQGTPRAFIDSVSPKRGVHNPTSYIYSKKRPRKKVDGGEYKEEEKDGWGDEAAKNLRQGLGQLRRMQKKDPNTFDRWAIK